VVLLIIVGIATSMSFYFLLWSSKIAKKYTYKDLSRHSMGYSLGVIVDIIIIIDCLSTVAAYQRLIGDSIEKFLAVYIAPDSPILNSNVIIGISLIITVPLCLLKNISWLEITSFLSILPLIYLIILQIIYLAMYGTPDKILLVGDYEGFFLALPIFVFAFSAQAALFPIYNDLKKSKGTHRDMFVIVNWSMVLTALSYGFCGGIGVEGYPVGTKGNITLNLPNGIPVSILLITMAISIILSIPVVLWPMRESLDQLIISCWRKYQKKPQKTDPTIPYDNFSVLSYLRYTLETLFLIGLSLLIAIGIPSFATILGLSGSLTKMIICFLFPCIFFIRLSENRYPAYLKIMAWGLLVVGVLAGLTSAVITILEYQKKFSPTTVPLQNSTVS